MLYPSNPEGLDGILQNSQVFRHDAKAYWNGVDDGMSKNLLITLMILIIEIS